MEVNTKGKLIILSAPSGSGKTTIMRRVLELFPNLEFSISATSRTPRHNEQHGVDYYFIEPAEFLSNVENDKFVEWEEVYEGTHYGTLRSEMQRIWDSGNTIIFDVDVKGGIRLKNIFGDNALSIFIMPPSVGELRKRLVGRGTDTSEKIEQRVAKAETEIADAEAFDKIIVNDELDHAVAQVAKAISDFIAK